MFKTLLTILAIWFLVRMVSRLFLPNARKRRRQKSVLYQIFSQMQNQANNGSGSSQSSGPRNPGSNSGPNKRKDLEDIEEADFEDITDEDRN